MTRQDEKDFKRLIKESTLEVLTSSEGKNAIKEGTLQALKSEEGKDILTDNFVDGFNQVVLPELEEHHNKIKKIERKLGIQSI